MENLFELEVPAIRDHVYRETSPEIVENTERVRKQYEESFNSESSPNTRYFTFSSPAFNGAVPLIGTSRTNPYKEGIILAGELSEQERVRGQFDKKNQKEFAKGIFEIAPSLYLGRLFHPGSVPISISYSTQDWNGFPTNEVVEAIKQKKGRSFILENMVDGFRIKTNKKGDYTVSTKNAEVEEAYQKVKDVSDPNERLPLFLKEMSDREISFPRISYEHFDESLRDGVLEGILKHSKNLYIKPSITGGGYSVFRINKQKGNLVESDSKEFQDYLSSIVDEEEDLALVITNMVNRIERLRGHNAPDVILDNENRRLKESRVRLDSFRNDKERCNLKRLLTHLIPYPIVEEEIPFATFTQRGEVYRPEFRIICQDTGNGFETEAYTKLGKSDVSANISLGASVTDIENALMSVYFHTKGQFPKSTHLNNLEESLIERSKEVARRQLEHYGEKVNGDEPKNPRDLAIDVVPSINSETGELDFYFMEINWQYGFSGLRSVDPEAAQRVDKNKFMLEGEK